MSKSFNLKDFESELRIKFGIPDLVVLRTPSSDGFYFHIFMENIMIDVDRAVDLAWERNR